MSKTRSVRSCTFFLVLTGFAALLCAPQAQAGWPWKKKNTSAQSAAATASATGTRPASSAAKEIFQRGASLLGAPADGVAPGRPEVVASISHELSQLESAAAEVNAAQESGDVGYWTLSYGNALAQFGHDADAALAYQQAVQADPSLVAAHLNMAALFRRAGLLDEARVLLQDVLVRSPGNGLAWFNLALTEERLNDGDAADTAYLQALRLDPSLWLPAKNPMIVGNRRANAAIHRNYLQRQGGDKILLDGGP